jgi:signal peptidase I
VAESINTELEKARTSLDNKNWEQLSTELEQLDKLSESHLAGFQPNKYMETAKSFLIAVAIALFIRWLFIEPFRIPSGSMIPTLLVGDQLMVNKFVYGPNVPFTTKKLFMPRMPRRGEVVVFKYPLKISDDYIKRVIGLPGDEILVADGNVYINGEKVEKIHERTVPKGKLSCNYYNGCDLFTEQLGDINHYMYLHHSNHVGVDQKLIRVPEGRLFVMGDNRDTSHDSRGWGFVPLDNLKGKAMFIHLPLDPSRHYMPRWNRFFKWIN